jgi:hypothetical protein
MIPFAILCGVGVAVTVLAMRKWRLANALLDRARSRAAIRKWRRSSRVKEFHGGVTAPLVNVIKEGDVAELTMRGNEDANGFALLSGDHVDGLVVRDEATATDLLSVQPTALISAVDLTVPEVNTEAIDVASETGIAQVLLRGTADADGYSLRSTTHAGGAIVYDVTNTTALLTMQPAVITSGVPVKLLGQTSGAAIATGYLGQVITSSASVLPTAAGVAYADATTITLTAGVWDIFLSASVTQVGAGTGLLLTGISATIGDSATGLVQGDNYVLTSTTATLTQGNAHTRVRVNISASTPYYAKYQQTAVTWNLYVKLEAYRVA